MKKIILSIAIVAAFISCSKCKVAPDRFMKIEFIDKGIENPNIFTDLLNLDLSVSVDSEVYTFNIGKTIGPDYEGVFYTDSINVRDVNTVGLDLTMHSDSKYVNCYLYLWINESDKIRIKLEDLDTLINLDEKIVDLKILKVE